ncbi:MAG: hypothetical protein LBU13_07415 [Synergistaceae bacterium]|jgi:hypothetical protein|nr:hypothetical protein [Synergistaceae bacterium]
MVLGRMRDFNKYDAIIKKKRKRKFIIMSALMLLLSAINSSGGRLSILWAGSVNVYSCISVCVFAVMLQSKASLFGMMNENRRLWNKAIFVSVIGLVFVYLFSYHRTGGNVSQSFYYYLASQAVLLSERLHVMLDAPYMFGFMSLKGFVHLQFYFINTIKSNVACSYLDMQTYYSGYVFAFVFAVLFVRPVNKHRWLMRSTEGGLGNGSNANRSPKQWKRITYARR